MKLSYHRIVSYSLLYSLQLSVKQLVWELTPVILRQWYLLGTRWITSFGSAGRPLVMMPPKHLPGDVFLAYSTRRRPFRAGKKGLGGEVSWPHCWDSCPHDPDQDKWQMARWTLLMEYNQSIIKIEYKQGTTLSHIVKIKTFLKNTVVTLKVRSLSLHLPGNAAYFR